MPKPIGLAALLSQVSPKKLAGLRGSMAVAGNFAILIG
jgi:hypothetical protein